MEEDIEILEEFIEDYNACYPEEKEWVVIYPNQIQAIENLINRNKELEEDYTSVYLSGFYDGENKWKSKIKETIEELDEELEIMKVDAMYGRYKEYDSKLSFEKQFSYKYGMHDVLQELLEKRK